MRAGQVSPRHPLADPQDVAVTLCIPAARHDLGHKPLGFRRVDRRKADGGLRLMVLDRRRLDRAGVFRVFPFEDHLGRTEVDHGQAIGEVLGGDGDPVTR